MRVFKLSDCEVYLGIREDLQFRRSIYVTELNGDWYVAALSSTSPDWKELIEIIKECRRRLRRKLESIKKRN